MIHVQGDLPKTLVIACSGGVDSMAITDFLARKHSIALQFVHHNTETSDEAHEFLRSYAKRHGFRLFVDRISSDKPEGQSQEEYWRNERYRILKDWGTPVVTAHHLNDCVETWIWSSLHGEGKVIPYSHGNVIRPFRLTTKEILMDWCVRHKVDWVEDKSNTDTTYIRNYIRHELMPMALKVNPGLFKVVRKKMLTP